MRRMGTWLVLLAIGCGGATAESTGPDVTDDLDLAGSPFERAGPAPAPAGRDMAQPYAMTTPARAPSAPIARPSRPASPARSVSLSVPRDARFTGKPIDLDVKDADIHNVIRVIADAGDVNIVIPDDVTGRITLTVRGIPWDQVLDLMVRSQGLTFSQNGNVITLHPAPR